MEPQSENWHFLTKHESNLSLRGQMKPGAAADNQELIYFDNLEIQEFAEVHSFNTWFLLDAIVLVIASYVSTACQVTMI